jgi:hypothetical protein
MVENLENGAPGKEREKIGAADLGITLSRNRSIERSIRSYSYIPLSASSSARRGVRPRYQQPRPARTLHG